MEAINQKRNKGIDELDIVDMLCSTGYLPPRNEQDIELFDRIYKGREYKMTAHIIDADDIFNKVVGGEKVITKKMTPKVTIFDRPGALRVANNASETIDDSVADTFNQLIKDKQD